MTAPTYQLLVIDDSARDTLLLERMLHQSEEAREINAGASAAVGRCPIRCDCVDCADCAGALPPVDAAC